jgi:hypothetical protein
MESSLLGAGVERQEAKNKLVSVPKEYSLSGEIKEKQVAEDYGMLSTDGNFQMLWPNFLSLNRESRSGVTCPRQKVSW